MGQPQNDDSNRAGRLKLKRDVDISGNSFSAPTIHTSYSRFVPRVGKPKRIGSRLLFIFLLVFAAAVLRVGYDFYQYFKAAHLKVLSLAYGETCTHLYDQVFAPLDIEAPNPSKDIHKFAGLCEQRVRDQAPDSNLAYLAAQLCSRLVAANSTRENYETTYRYYVTSPPTVLEKGRRDLEEIERNRRSQFYANNLAIQPWNRYVHAERPRCAEILQKIIAYEKSFDKPSSLLRHFIVFAKTYFQPVVRWIPASLSMRDKTAVAETVCSACGGRRQVKCSACNGRGSVSENIQVACEQCGGSGVYRLKMSKSSRKCNFCGGSGFESKTKAITCPTCNGRGMSNCALCGGTGKANGITEPAK